MDQASVRRAAQALIQASERSKVAPFLALDVLREANRLEASGETILHLEVGQPAAPAPEGVRRAVADALMSAHPVGYTEALGTTALRERIARYYRETHAIDVAPERIAVTTGSSSGFILAFLAAFDAGGAIGLPTPAYPAYANILSALGMRAVWIETDAASRWAATPDMLDAAGDLDGLLVASPGNPSGTVVGARAMGELVEAAHRRGIRFISDEIYHGLDFGERPATALSFTDDAIVINSFSKYYCMTGWRIGWMVVPDSLARPLERLAQNLFISPPALSQIAALAAFDCTDELEANKAVYAANRALIQARLPAIGLDRLLPMDGAFYAYVDVSRFTNDSRDFAARLLRETGIATTPGVDFDPARGHRFLRLSFAGSTDVVSRAVERIGDWLPR